MPRLRPPLHLSPARAQQLQSWALAALALLLALGGVADVSVNRPRGPYDWRERVIVLLPGVCAQPAELPPTPNLPSVPLAQPPGQWPTWPDWLTCGGAEATQNARARALGTFVGGWGSPAQLANRLHQALQNGSGNGHSSGTITFSIRAIESFSYAGVAPTYTSSQTRQALAVSAAALDAQLRRWRGAYPNATFDLIGHSLGGAVAVYWAASVATPDEERSIHSIITLDSPLGGYPRSYADNFFLPFFGPVAQGLLAGSLIVRAIAGAPGHWRTGPGTLANPIVTMTNVRDLAVPFFVATISGAVLVADDYGPDSSSLNHGSVLTSPAALAQIAQVLAQEGMPLLNTTEAALRR
jgi:pimeloyl-ACP methyl ester carboxylesterase